jgi:hypothetical protein
MLKITYYLLLLTLLFACDQQSSAYSEASLENDYSAAQEEKRATSSVQNDNDQAEAEQVSGAPASPADSNEQPTKAMRKIIYTASARIRVDSLDVALPRLTTLVRNNGGFLSNQVIQDNTYNKTATLEIRLPVEGFGDSVEKILALGNFVDEQTLNSRDVSAEWIDLESRLATKRLVRDRYIEVLRKQAKKVEDILAAEEKIRVITEEIEAKESRLRYLRDQISLSTFTLTMYETKNVEDVPPAYVRSFGQELKDALGNGMDLVKGLLYGALSIWPLFFLFPILLWAYRRWRKR